MIPFTDNLVGFMNEVRDGEHDLTHMHMINYMKLLQTDWLSEYLSSKSNDTAAYHSLLSLCQRFSARHRISQRVPCISKVHQGELSEVRDDFARDFCSRLGEHCAGDIINLDETAVYYDMPPCKTLAKVGGSSHVDTSQKHSDRITAVMAVRSSGEKLPILFILRGKPGGVIETDELPLYPPEHVYVVQESAWMDKRVWAHYLKELLKFEIRGPTVILADNLDCHVSPESSDLVSTELYSVLEPLSKNSTSVCQPLDIGVLRPLKSKLRAKWLHERPVSEACEKRLAMINRTIAAWNEMSTELIQKAFSKAIPKVSS
ncbi:hypothetical protein LEN26_012615 [Aphanomyces euteiches]|nr:hypothetical protein AeMF1_019768 [Aphanomyces euteiches]KAH9117535.1 hypothetical protein LEN26_012615 [Aphanomyces euteiches]KAH9165457.1 hypothetical protein AeNC1_018510 [Aphanomyces euteiches]